MAIIDIIREQAAAAREGRATRHVATRAAAPARDMTARMERLGAEARERAAAAAHRFPRTIVGEIVPAAPVAAAPVMIVRHRHASGAVFTIEHWAAAPSADVRFRVTLVRAGRIVARTHAGTFEGARAAANHAWKVEGRMHRRAASAGA